jgi:5-formyltetrahydrofolate cyclo-ligase
VDARRAIENAKASLRRQIRQGRLARPLAERAYLARALRDVAMEAPPLRSAHVVTCYLDARGEPGTKPLRTALAEAGVQVLLPVVLTAETHGTLDWAVDDGTSEPGPYRSLPQPAGQLLGPDALAKADVVLAPALAVDTLGHRLGQGGGFYDRALQLARLDAPVVAVVHDDEVLDADVEPVPALPHDRRVSAVLTPTRWITIG